MPRFPKVREEKAGQKPSWLDYEHDEFRHLKARYAECLDHYTGELLDSAKISEYLIQKTRGEHDESYQERANRADFATHLATVVDSLAGMLYHVDAQTTRTFGETAESKGLGDPTDPKTLVGRIYQNADGRGRNYLAMVKGWTVDLTLLHRVWIMVDTEKVQGEERAVLRTLPVLSVPNWMEGEDGLSSVLIRERVDVRRSLKDKPEAEPRWLEVTLDGWQRWKKNREGEPTHDGEFQSWSHGGYLDSEGRRALPIFRVDLPLGRMVGWLLARRSNAIFNKESERDHLITVANFPKLNIMGGDGIFKKVIAAILKGDNALQNDPDAQLPHNYIAPSADPAKIATEVLDKKIENFYVNAFQEYGDAAAQKTATEVRQDTSKGVAAFLQLLASAMDEVESNAWWRIAQTEKPQEKSLHFVTAIVRPDTFDPPDIDEIVDGVKKRYFGGDDKPVPAGVEGKAAALKMILEHDGFEVEEEVARAAVQVASFAELQATFVDLRLPPALKARITVAAAVALGLIEADEVVKTGDGTTTRKMVDMIREQAEQAEEEAAEERRLAAERYRMPV